MHVSKQTDHQMSSSGLRRGTYLSRQAQRNLDRILQLEEAMFLRRSRYLVLVLTLSYQEAYKHWITLETIQQHRDQLLKNQRSNRLLQDIEGYAWKIEEGPTSGLHLHIVIFYSGKHQADVYFAQSIGEYWVNVITAGMGCYWNSNAHKEFHVRYGHGDGTGQINRDDHAKRGALRLNLMYLVKDEQSVSNKANRYERMFGTSQPPR